MACFHPIPAQQNGANGPVRLHPQIGAANLALPCGRCIGCRTDKATQWANRCSHEASMYSANIFLTLTYDDDHFPANGYLDATHLRNFIKRLRERERTKAGGTAPLPPRHPPHGGVKPSTAGSLRYFACGEYGEHTGRPHYHAIVFNYEPPDKYRVGKNLYESDYIKQLWPYGQNRIGDATAAAAAYIAQYSLKKQGRGDFTRDGEWRPAPFLRMSLRPAIGTEWLKQYKTDLRYGYLVDQKGSKQNVPRHYKTKIKELDSQLHEEMEHNQKRRQMDTKQNRNDPDRLKDEEVILTAKKRMYDNRTL